MGQRCADPAEFTILLIKLKAALGSVKKYVLQDYAGFLFIFKAQKQAHSSAM
jgi:hypothetical protein